MKLIVSCPCCGEVFPVFPEEEDQAPFDCDEEDIESLHEYLSEEH